MSNKSHALKRAGLGIVAIILLCGNNCPPIKLKPQDKYFLAYVKDGSSDVRARWSKDGLAWEEGSFPVGALSASTYGVGAAADRNGLLRILMASGTNNINFVWGLGPAIWDNSDVSQTTHPPASAPSSTYIGDSRWLIAYRRGDGTVTVSVYDTQARSIIIPDVAPMGSLNTNVIGRPAITSMGDKVLLAWQRQGLELITAVGQVQGGIPVFSQPQDLPLPVTAEYQAGLRSDPDVTNDNSHFYIAYIREERGSGAGSLHGWDPEVRSSVDGQSWQFHSSGVFLDHVVYNTFVNIAAQNDGTMMAASVRDNGVISAARYSNGQWDAFSDQQAQAMFGANKANAKQFALIGSKIATENP